MAAPKSPNPTAPKSPNPTDVYVGSRLRSRRMMAGMSQGKLAEALGLTFQQVQKYEKGANRIGASRLHQISQILRVPESYFFEGAPDANGKPGRPVAEDPNIQIAASFMATTEGVMISRCFPQIKNVSTRRLIAKLIQDLGSSSED